jgi:hypothetical protein
MGTMYVTDMKERGHAEDLSIVGKIILDWISRKQDGRVWT